MPFSLLNGLSGLGAGLADYAGRAGLEAQKADLQKQSLVLADQLATTRESTGRREAAGYATAAATAEHDFLGTQGDLQRATQVQTAQIGAGATLGSAAMSAAASRYAADTQSKNVYASIAAAAPEQAARILAQNQQTALNAVQTQNASDLRDAHTALQAETGKPDADPTKIAGLKSQVTSLETSAATEAATTTAAAAMFRTDMDAVQHFNTQLVTATAALNAPDMSDTDRTAQKGLVADLRTQLAGAQRALKYSSDLVHGRVGAQTGNSLPGSPAADNRPPLASFGGAAPLPNPNAGPRAAPPPTIPGFGFLNNGASP